MDTRIELITPEIAKEYLEMNTNNRAINSTRVNDYTKELKLGLWETTHQGIAFFANGTLADGQHRLMAIVKSGVSVKIMVTRGLTENAGLALDRGKMKKVHEAIKIAKYPEWINQKAVSVANAMTKEQITGTMSPVKVGDFCLKHETEMRFVLSYFKSKITQLSLAHVCAAICLSLIAEPSKKERISRFLEIYISGEYSGEKDELAPVRLRNMLLKEGAMLQKSANGREKILRFTQLALKFFFEGKEISRFKDPEKIFYPKV